MYDQFNRKIHYLRISVTDRCNLRCRYCMPAEGIKLLRHEDILSLEEIFEVAEVAVSLGIDKVRVTGGEPLVRKGVVGLIEKLSQLKGIHDLAMTTNGQLLAEYAAPLAAAGLKRINISLDTCNPDRYQALTRGGDIRKVIQGMVAAQKAGLAPIKLNCVIKENAQEEDALGVKIFAKKMGMEVRFIHQMDLHDGHFSIVEGGSGGDCSRCNRLRLTADGKIKPCLFSDLEFDVRKLGIREALEKALQQKPACGGTNQNNLFYNIGG